MLTREDEIKDNAHCKASLLEFIEMVCRIAYIGSYPPSGENVDSDDE